MQLAATGRLRAGNGWREAGETASGQSLLHSTRLCSKSCQVTLTPSNLVLLPHTLLASHYYNKILQRFFLSTEKAMLHEILKKDYIQLGAIYEITFFFGFLVSSNTLSLQITKKHIFELLIAFNIIHLIYKIVHNIYLTSIALKTTLGTVKQPTISKHKGVAKNSTFTFFFFAFPPWLGLRIIFHLAFFGSHAKTVHLIPK